MAIGAGFGAGTLLGAAAAAFTAVFQAGDLNIPGAALYRLHKGDGNLRFPVLAADGPIGVPYPAAAKAAKAASAEDISEQVAQIAKATEAIAGVHSGKAELIIPLALLLIGEHLVRLVDLLKLSLGFLIAGVQVGVVFLCQLAESLFYFILAGALLQAQHLIVISFLCHSSHPLLQDHAEKMVLSSASRTAQRQNCLCAPHYNLFFG